MPSVPDASLPPLRIGCVGCGSMGGALLRGLSASSATLYGVDHHPERLEKLATYGVQACADVATLTRQTDLVILAVKPHAMTGVLRETLPFLTPQKTVISLAAGLSVDALRKAVENRAPVVRVMPNTPVMVGKGAFALCLDDPNLSTPTRERILALFQSMGAVSVLPESKFSAYTAFIGCGPAYVFYFMEALAEAGVTLGFPRQQALDMAIQLFAGSAKLAGQPGAHPSLLREQVCSPGGVTIAAINHFDRHAVRGHIVDALLAAYAKDKELEHVTLETP